MAQYCEWELLYLYICSICICIFGEFVFVYLENLQYFLTLDFYFRRWVHMAQYCEWEWKSPEEGTVITGCTMQGVGFVIINIVSVIIIIIIISIKMINIRSRWLATTQSINAASGLASSARGIGLVISIFNIF